MRQLLTLLFTLWFLSSPLIAYSAGVKARFKRISIEHGLSQNAVYHTFQDSQGFLWFGTQDGLNRYDGYEFKVFRHNPQNPDSLSNNFIWSIFEDSNGGLWIGTRSGGLNHFDRQTERFTHYRYERDNPHSLGNNDVRVIFEDDKGVLWVGTNGGGLNRFDSQTGQFERFVHDSTNPHSLSSDKVLAIHQDKKGQYWIGTWNGGLNLFNPDNGRFSHYQYQPDNPQSLSNNNVFALHEDQNGLLWIGTRGGGLNRFDTVSEVFTRFEHDAENRNSLSHNKIISIHRDSKNRLWLGTYGGGLNRFDMQTEQFEHFRFHSSDSSSLSSDRIWSLYEDRNGSLWVGTGDNGVNKYDMNEERFGLYRHRPSDPDSISQNAIWAMHASSRGPVWVGTHAGLNRFDPITGKFQHFRHSKTDPHSLSHDAVYAIYEDKQGLLWIGTTGGGLNRFDQNSGQFSHFRHNPSDPHSLANDGVITILEDSTGVLWVGTNGGGLDKLDKSTGHFEHFNHQPTNSYSLSQDAVRAIFEDINGTLWVGTTDGLNRYNRQNKRFKRYHHQPSKTDSLSHSSVKSIYQDNKGTLWVGTDGGLNKFDYKTNTFTRYQEKDGLANDVTYGIVEDDQDHLWLSTNQGLSHFDPQTERFRNYDVNDGLQSNEFNLGAFTKGVDGALYFGGINGFNRFFAANIVDDKTLPVVALTDLLLANQSVVVKPQTALTDTVDETKLAPFTINKTINTLGQLTLNHRQNLMSFEFAALHFANPMKNRYAYQLEGWDQDWIYTDAQNRRATYTNIPDGHYILRVKASNKDGYWQPQGKSLKIRILPPPWKTWWAYTIYGLLLSGLLLAFVKSQRRKVYDEHELNLKLERKVAERTIELEQAAKMASLGTLTAGVAHEINNPTNFVHVSAQNMQVALTRFETFLFGLVSDDADEDILNSFRQRLKPLHEHLLTIEDGTERIKAIVQDLRIFTQLNASDQKTVNITGLLLSTIHLVRTKYLEVVDFSTDFKDDPELLCYPAQLNQVFMNLIVNACDAIREKQGLAPESTGHGKISISCELQDNMIEILIEDDGCGMTEQTQSQLFEPFFSTKKDGEGTGLGLSISFGIVQKHGGELIVCSKLNIGTKFKVRLPIHQI